MKKIIPIVLISFIFSSCSFVDESRIEKSSEIPVDSFLEQTQSWGNVNSTITTTEDFPEKTREDTSGSKTRNTHETKMIDATITESDLSLSGSDVTWAVLKDTSEKDIELLINNLFDSTHQ